MKGTGKEIPTFEVSEKKPDEACKLRRSFYLPVRMLHNIKCCIISKIIIREPYPSSADFRSIDKPAPPKTVIQKNVYRIGAVRVPLMNSRIVRPLEILAMKIPVICLLHFEGAN